MDQLVVDLANALNFGQLKSVSKTSLGAINKARKELSASSKIGRRPIAFKMSRRKTKSFDKEGTTNLASKFNIQHQQQRKYDRHHCAHDRAWKRRRDCKKQDWCSSASRMMPVAGVPGAPLNMKFLADKNKQKQFAAMIMTAASAQPCASSASANTGANLNEADSIMSLLKFNRVLFRRCARPNKLTPSGNSSSSSTTAFVTTKRSKISFKRPRMVEKTYRYRSYRLRCIRLRRRYRLERRFANTIATSKAKAALSTANVDESNSSYSATSDSENTNDSVKNTPIKSSLPSSSSFNSILAAKSMGKKHSSPVINRSNEINKRKRAIEQHAIEHEKVRMQQRYSRNSSKFTFDELRLNKRLKRLCLNNSNVEQSTNMNNKIENENDDNECEYGSDLEPSLICAGPSSEFERLSSMETSKKSSLSATAVGLRDNSSDYLNIEIHSSSPPSPNLYRSMSRLLDDEDALDLADVEDESDAYEKFSTLIKVGDVSSTKASTIKSCKNRNRSNIKTSNLIENKKRRSSIRKELPRKAKFDTGNYNNDGDDEKDENENDEEEKQWAEPSFKCSWYVYVIKLSHFIYFDFLKFIF
jgi:hypothetical protein